MDLIVALNSRAWAHATIPRMPVPSLDTGGGDANELCSRHLIVVYLQQGLQNASQHIAYHTVSIN